MTPLGGRSPHTNVNNHLTKNVYCVRIMYNALTIAQWKIGRFPNCFVLFSGKRAGRKNERACNARGNRLIFNCYYNPTWGLYGESLERDRGLADTFLVFPVSFINWQISYRHLSRSWRCFIVWHLNPEPELSLNLPKFAQFCSFFHFLSRKNLKFKF